MNGSATDPAGVLDPLNYSWDFDGDGQFDDATGVSPDFSAVGLDGPIDVTIWFRVADDDSGVETASVVIGVTNASPSADAGGPYTAAEGGSVVLDGSSSSDPGNDTLTYAWDLDGDGQYDDASGASPSFSAATLDGPTTVTVGLRVTDDDGATDTSTADITVTNAAPVADAGGPYTVDEGSSVTLDGSASDASSLDTFSYAWDFDGDGEYDDATGQTPSFSAATLDGPTTVTVGLRVTDDDGDSHTATADVTVDNVAPVADAGGPYTVDEGSSITLDGSGSDASSLDTLLYAWDFDRDGEYDDATGQTPTFSAATLDGPTTVTVGLRVTDDDGDSHTATADVTVDNVAPEADAGGPYTVAEGGSVVLDGSASDASSLDTFSYAWDFDGDGEYDDATGQTPTFSAVGLDGPTSRNVSLRVTDDDGSSDTATVAVTVTNVAPSVDPGGPYTVAEGGSVTLNGSATDPGRRPRPSELQLGLRWRWPV